MDRRMVFRVSGYCPEQACQASIVVSATEFPGIHGRKITSYSCAYQQENGCTAQGPKGRDCPLYLSAKQC